jgi:GDPmannose 4,6-dehydratase
MKKVLITGITGQDGSYLAEHLLEEGYEVHGIVRRQSVSENQSSRIQNIMKEIYTHYGDLLDSTSLVSIFEKVKPDQIYNLGAMSHVRISFDIPEFTINTNGMGALRMLDLYKHYSPESSYYQASSSEMFGNSVDEDGYQRLSTPMTPVSPYGCAKVLAFNLTRHYRDAYKLKASNGVLFNHESPRRGMNFVTNKVIKTAFQIKYGETDKLYMGNLDSYRDWGHSYDYVRAMKKIVEYPSPEDWIISTGKTNSVRELCNIVFSSLNMNYEDYVVQKEEYMRPEELQYLRGDNTKALSLLNWKPTYSFETLIEEMITEMANNYENR